MDEKNNPQPECLRLDRDKLVADLRATAKWLFENKDSMPPSIPKEHSEVIRTAILFVIVLCKAIPAAVEVAGTLLNKMVGDEVKE